MSETMSEERVKRKSIIFIHPLDTCMLNTYMTLPELKELFIFIQAQLACTLMEFQNRTLVQHFDCNKPFQIAKLRHYTQLSLIPRFCLISRYVISVVTDS